LLIIKKYEEIKANKQEIAQMIKSFRNFLASLKKRDQDMTVKEALKELEYYNDKIYPIYTAVINKDDYAGYFILKYDDDGVWLEHFFVKEVYRKQDIGSKMFQKAEKVVEQLGYVYLYNWVHPNNYRMINFLKKQGYDVLNMIEIRKKIKKEKFKSSINVGKSKFRYN